MSKRRRKGTGIPPMRSTPAVAVETGGIVRFPRGGREVVQLTLGRDVPRAVIVLEPGAEPVLLLGSPDMSDAEAEVLIGEVIGGLSPEWSALLVEAVEAEKAA